jgi:Ca2+/H+ antiporter, TMEM165/GDT1 family
MDNRFDHAGKHRFRRFRGFFPLLIIGFILLGGYAVMLLWNNIIPFVIPVVKPLIYWQAVGLLLLARILFGGFRGGRCGPFGRGDFRGGSAWRQKMMDMTDEEREKFKSEWKERYRGNK